MIGVAAFLGTPSAPWHVLQTSNLAPRKASASAAFPGVATAGFSTACSTAFAGTARAIRTPNTVAKRSMIMFTLPLFECPRFQRHPGTSSKHAAVEIVAQDG